MFVFDPCSQRIYINEAKKGTELFKKQTNKRKNSASSSRLKIFDPDSILRSKHITVIYKTVILTGQRAQRTQAISNC